MYIFLQNKQKFFKCLFIKLPTYFNLNLEDITNIGKTVHEVAFLHDLYKSDLAVRTVVPVLIKPSNE